MDKNGNIDSQDGNFPVIPTGYIACIFSEYQSLIGEFYLLTTSTICKSSIYANLIKH